MHVKKGLSVAEQRRLLANDDSTTDSDEIEDHESPSDARPSPSSVKGKKRKIAPSTSPTDRPDDAKRDQDESCHAEAAPLAPQTVAAVEDPTTELQLVAIAARRLDFEVLKWKHEHARREETLTRKRKEIQLREATTKAQQKLQRMDVRARILLAVDQSGQSPSTATQYLALLDN